MAVTLKGQTAVYEGTSTDTKPTDADNNAIFIELDTDKRYYYDGTDWNEMPSSGSGGGFTPTSTQLAAMNSGITAEDVTQIGTNENNISSIVDGTTLDSFGDVETALGDKADADNVYKLALSNADLLPANTDLDNVKTVGCYFVLAAVTVPTIIHRPTENTSAFRVTVELAAGTIRPRQIYQEYNSYDKYIRVENSNGVFGAWKKVEADLSTKQDTLTTEQLAAVNSGITSEIFTTDTAALIELVDSGAKNIINNTATTQTVNGITFTVNANGTITANGTATDNASIAIYFENNNIVGKPMVVSGCPQGGSTTTYRCFLQKIQSGIFTTVVTLTGGSGEIVPDIETYRYLITVYNGYVVDDLVFSPMLCRKIAWDISQTYQPYAMSNAELTAAKLDKSESYGLSHAIESSVSNPFDLDTLKQEGRYRFGSLSDSRSLLHAPSTAIAGTWSTSAGICTIEVKGMNTDNRYMQELTEVSFATTDYEIAIYQRFWNGTVWGKWYKFSGTVVT